MKTSYVEGATISIVKDDQVVESDITVDVTLMVDGSNYNLSEATLRAILREHLTKISVDLHKALGYAAKPVKRWVKIGGWWYGRGYTFKINSIDRTYVRGVTNENASFAWNVLNFHEYFKPCRRAVHLPGPRERRVSHRRS